MIYSANSDPPAVTVVTTVRNAKDTILECLESVAGQRGSYAKEHIVVDGDSTDGTQEILQQHASQLGAFISEPDKGIYEGMNKGLGLAQGEVIGFLNADDRFVDDQVLADILARFENPRVAAVYGDLVYTQAGGKIVRQWRAGAFQRHKFYWGWMPPHPTFYARRRYFQDWGGFNTRFGSAADYELMLRFLVRHRLPADYLPRTLVNMRVGGISNASLSNRLRAHRMDRQAWHHNRLTPKPWTLWLKPLRKLSQFVPLTTLFQAARSSTL